MPSTRSSRDSGLVGCPSRIGGDGETARARKEEARRQVGAGMAARGGGRDLRGGAVVTLVSSSFSDAVSIEGKSAAGRRGTRG